MINFNTTEKINYLNSILSNWEEVSGADEVVTPDHEASTYSLLKEIGINPKSDGKDNEFSRLELCSAQILLYIEQFKNNPDGDLRIEAIEALAKLKSKAAMVIYKEYLEEELLVMQDVFSPESNYLKEYKYIHGIEIVFTRIIQELGKAHYEPATEVIAKYLYKPGKEAAIEALGKIANDQAARALYNFIKGMQEDLPSNFTMYPHNNLAIAEIRCYQKAIAALKNISTQQAKKYLIEIEKVEFKVDEKIAQYTNEQN
ncbi:MAG: hypothetical protein KKA19_09060 [Candidatus Margulisbacteria bacterium]|nr:hypothetical protein [Candidatus Margulisiibacteriota bacterium]